MSDQSHSNPNHTSTRSHNNTGDDRIGLSLGALVAFVLVGFCAVLARTAQLQAMPGEALTAHAPRTVSSRPEMALRGDLLDRRGRVLATSRLGYRLFVDPQVVEDVYSIGAELGLLLGRDPVELDRKIQQRLDTRYCALIDLLTDIEAETVRNAKYPGVGLEPLLVRHRPYGDLAAAIIGKVGRDHIGRTGLEGVLNDDLTGDDGSLTYLRDVGRNAMWVESDGFKPAQPGIDVQLTIDAEMQRLAMEALDAAVTQYNANGGRVVVFDPLVGEIRAMGDVIHDRPGIASLISDPLRKKEPTMARLRVLTDPYEPGSTFKAFVWARSTELGRVTVDEVFDTHHGLYRAPNRRLIHDAYPYEELAWDMVLVKSSNIGMVQVVDRMTHKELQDVVSAFGFGTPTGCGLPAETGGIVTSPKDWSTYTQQSVAMGHEIAVTPLQMVRAFSAFCRDGSLPEVRIIRGKDQPGDAPLQGHLQARVHQQPIKPETVALTRQVMRKLMKEGSGRRAEEGARYRMFGKSGTAEFPKPDGGGYFKQRYVSSFIAGAPLDDPRLVVLVVLEDPDRSIGHFGGAICGPIARDIMNGCLEYLGVPSDLALDKVELDPMGAVAAQP